MNLKDFPQRAADPYAIQIRHPDAFLSDQLDLDPHRTGAAIENLVSLYKAPRLDALELMCRLRVTVPNFAQLVGSQLVRGESFDMGPAMLVQSTSAEAFTSFVPTGDLDLSQPQNVAYHWWAAALNLPELHPLFDSLCLKPGDWKDRRTLDAMLDGLSLASGVDPAIETPDRMAFVKLVTVTGEESVQVFGAGTLKGPLRVITLVKVDDEWKVFALSDDYLPAARVFDDWSYRRS